MISAPVSKALVNYLSKQLNWDRVWEEHFTKDQTYDLMGIPVRCCTANPFHPFGEPNKHAGCICVRADDNDSTNSTTRRAIIDDVLFIVQEVEAKNTEWRQLYGIEMIHGMADPSSTSQHLRERFEAELVIFTLALERVAG